MQKKHRILVSLPVVVLCAAFAVASDSADYFAGQDMHLVASKMIVYPSPGGNADEQIVVFQDCFSLEIGDSTVSSDSAVAWINTRRTDHRGTVSVDYDVRVYLQGNIRAFDGKGARTADIKDVFVEYGRSLVVYYFVSGEVFATAEQQVAGSFDDLAKIGIYQKASKAMRPMREALIVDPEAMIPQYRDNLTVVHEKFARPAGRPLRVSDVFDMTEDGKLAVAEPKRDFPAAGKPEAAASVPELEDTYRYPVNISGLWQRKPELEVSSLPDGSNVATIIGRFYVWQKTDQDGGLIEFQADNGVIFYGSRKNYDSENTDSQSISGDQPIDAVYFQGNIIMTEGDRTIRAEELFYDFVNKRALAVKAEMRKFDENRGIPVYLRAAKLKQVTENVFKADQIVLTTSEFYLPQISMTASQLVMTDLKGVEGRADSDNDARWDAVLSDIRMKAGRATLFSWPGLRTNFERPDLPIRRVHVGRDSDFGTLVETRWYLSRILGLKEPEGVDSSLQVDYFSKRGVGGGAVIDYQRDDYFGGIDGYIIRDRGEDDLGRTRENIPTGQDIRGRFTARHRHYLPYDWQATLEVSYLSDKNFLESYYRTEFNSSKAQETLLYLKRLKDNWAFTFLSKLRINDFQTETEELPTVEYHLKGQSFFDNKLTFYSDTQVSRLRDRFDDQSDTTMPQQFYTFLSTRNEIDMPIRQGAFKFVPFIAGTYALEDQDGYFKNIDNTVNSNPKDNVLFGESGFRASTMFWKDDPTFKSEFWDVDGLRHIVTPHVEGVVFYKSNDVIEMRNFVNYGLTQRWLTHRGKDTRRRTLDWMKLDIDATFLNNRAEDSISPPSPNAYGPASFIWNDPAIPIFTRRNDTLFGMVRDSINANYSWRISDTTTFLGDMNYDVETGVIQQVDVGFARYVYPDVSFYVANRYLRPVIVSDPADNVFEKGSNSIIASITYAINNRYTAILSEEYNFDYGKNVRTMISLLRRYHRVYYGLSLMVDESRSENSIIFSIWPQGLKDLTFGNRKYASFRDGILED